MFVLLLKSVAAGRPPFHSLRKQFIIDQIGSKSEQRCLFFFLFPQLWSSVQPLNHATVHASPCMWIAAPAAITRYHCKSSCLTQPLTPVCLFCRSAEDFLFYIRADRCFFLEFSNGRWMKNHLLLLNCRRQNSNIERSLIFFSFISVFRSGCEWAGKR